MIRPHRARTQPGRPTTGNRQPAQEPPGRNFRLGAEPGSRNWPAGGLAPPAPPGEGPAGAPERTGPGQRPMRSRPAGRQDKYPECRQQTSTNAARTAGRTRNRQTGNGAPRQELKTGAEAEFATEARFPLQ